MLTLNITLRMNLIEAFLNLVPPKKLGLIAHFQKYFWSTVNWIFNKFHFYQLYILIYWVLNNCILINRNSINRILISQPCIKFLSPNFFPFLFLLFQKYLFLTFIGRVTVMVSISVAPVIFAFFVGELKLWEKKYLKKLNKRTKIIRKLL